MNSASDRLHALLDARMASWSGIGRYTTGLIRALDARDDLKLTILASSDARQIIEVGGKLKNIDYIDATANPLLPAGTHELTTTYLQSSADLLHCLHFCAPSRNLLQRPIVVTIHDLIPLAVPASMPNPFKRIVYKRKIGHTLQIACQIITPSQTTADDIQKYFPQAQIPIRIVAEAADDFGTEPLLQPSISYPYLLAMGNTKAHKNLDLLIKVMRKLGLSHSGIKLLLVGDTDEQWLSKQQKLFPQIRQHVHFTGAITDEQLRGYYAGAQAFLYPSLHEGFGLPPVEAAKFGIPVLTANIGAPSEVMGGAVLALDPHDAQAWISAIAKILSDKHYAQQLGQKAQLHAQSFNWAKTAATTVAVYQEACNITAKPPSLIRM